jgi:hypothetical protein
VTPADLERFLYRRLPDLDLRVIMSDDEIVVRYAEPAERGRRFPVLFVLRRSRGRWTPDREIERGVIGEVLEYLSLT